MSSRSHPAFELMRKLTTVPQALAGLVVLTLIAAAAVLSPWIVPVDAEEMDFDNLLSGPSAAHWLGSDQMGRDTLARLIVGARIALFVSLGAVGLGVLLGVPLGLLSVYFRGRVDDVLMRLMDALVVFPSLLIAVGLAAALGGSLRTVIVAIGIANVPWMARIIRSQGLSIRERDFVKAAEALGLSHRRIIMSHILPNCLAPVIVQSTLSMGYAVLTEGGPRLRRRRHPAAHANLGQHAPTGLPDARAAAAAVGRPGRGDLPAGAVVQLRRRRAAGSAGSPAAGGDSLRAGVACPCRSCGSAVADYRSFHSLREA